MPELLHTQDLTKNYQMGEVTVEALKGVDFVVAAGEFVAIMGPSGSGKSTLLHLLGGLDEASDGEVQLAGKRLAHMNDDEVTVMRRRQVGFVFQFFNLLPTLTAAENVALPLLLDGQRRSQYQPAVETALGLVGLTDRASHKPDQLSGGEQQRVAIARALVTEPAIVLADEPTGNLDSRAGEEVLKLLRQACDDRGQTIIMVTHDPMAASFADRIVFLKDGQLAGEIKNGEDGIDAQRITDAMARLGL
ncbi:MAG: ABC transporter ATP-binding protein [Anaerolineales bacterium]|jgi:putative ABC transport system ATP-binding protein